MNVRAEQQRARLSYEAALRALEHQQRGVEEIRARTGILLPTAAFSASFLGARAFDAHASVVLSVLALTALLITLICGIVVLLRDSTIGYAVSGRFLHGSLRGARDQAAQHRQLAALLDRLWEVNQSSIGLLNAWFRAAAVALVIQILCWTAAIGATL